MAGRVLVIGTLFATALAGSVAHADKEKADQKFCDALMKFHTDFAALEALGPSSTVGELRMDANKVSDDADQVQSAATKIKSPTAKQFTDAAKQLRKSVKSLPDSATIDQAKARIRDDVQNVKQSGHKLAMESGCSMPDEDMKAQPQEGTTPPAPPEGSKPPSQ